MSRFWDTAAKKYAASPVKDEAAYALTLSMVRNRLGTLASTSSQSHTLPRIFEIGAGTGSTALKLGPYTSFYLATDFSGAMMDIAREKLKLEEYNDVKEKVQFENLDICVPLTNHNFKDSDNPVSSSIFHQHKGSFDVALAFNLLYLLSDLPSAICNVHAALRPGGLFISKNIVSDGLSWKYLAMAKAIPLMTLFGFAPKGVKFMSTAELEGTMTKHGFEIVESIFPEGDPMRRYIVAKKV